MQEDEWEVSGNDQACYIASDNGTAFVRAANGPNTRPYSGTLIACGRPRRPRRPSTGFCQCPGIRAVLDGLRLRLSARDLASLFHSRLRDRRLDTPYPTTKHPNLLPSITAVMISRIQNHEPTEDQSPVTARCLLYRAASMANVYRTGQLHPLTRS